MNPKNIWVGLTDKERDDIINQAYDDYHDLKISDTDLEMAKNIEAKLKEKNTKPCKPLTDDEVISMARKHTVGGLEFDRNGLLEFFKEAIAKATSEN